MLFRRFGPSGLRVPVFSLGGWLTLEEAITGDPVKDIIKTAIENGINMFDTAEVYGDGRCEEEIGRVIKELGLRRSDLVISTKIFWGQGESPNSTGLSRKHIIEGTQDSLKRLQMDYVDIIYAHRPDRTTPIEETVRAFNYVIDKGWAFYWATSEWSAQEIQEAYHVADKLNLVPPIAEQCQHNMFHRQRPESEYAPLYAKCGYGKAASSPLAGGLLTGKYNSGKMPTNLRLDDHKDVYKDTLLSFIREEGRAKLEKVEKLRDFAVRELGCKVNHLALAWVASQPGTSTVVLGVSSPEQIIDNLKALEVLPKLTPEIMARIDAILLNKPKPESLYGRPRLDVSNATSRRR
ncbi:hypothetical protein M0805_004189 [Coniferiporia weirii]|nr:hypothetical protein M0805_004189 [Coniferiporia weirii]